MMTRTQILRIVRDGMIRQGALGDSAAMKAPDGRVCAIGAYFAHAYPDAFREQPPSQARSCVALLAARCGKPEFGPEQDVVEELWKKHDDAAWRPDGYLWFLVWLDEQIGDLVPSRAAIAAREERDAIVAVEEETS